MEILILAALSRTPMHGYELKLELAYKHVSWWAKCEHGHLYAALERLARGKYIRQIARRGGRTTQRVFGVTAAGKRRLASALETLGLAPDTTYFDIDMFLVACHVLDRERALAILDTRRAGLVDKAREARELATVMAPHVPAVGRLIMQHRIDYLEREVAFVDTCVATLRAEPTWGPFLGDTRIEEFVERSRVPVERV
jgi:DNA-binding PadR family transcriptional regulator